MDDKIRLNRYKDFKANKNLYLMMLPFLILFTAFVIIPVLTAIFFSFTNFNVLQFPRFIGLQNYKDLLLNDRVFRIALTNTLQFALIIGPGGFILAFLMAWLINELPPKIRAVFTIIFYAPSITGSIFMLFQIVFSGDAFGWLNAWMLDWGLIEAPILWLETPAHMKWITYFISLWMSLGFGFLTFIAGLQTVDKAQYEAAEVDGITNRWQELWYITLPSMKPQLMISSVLSVTGAFGIGSVTTAMFGFPSAQYGAHTIVNHLDDFGHIRMEMGYACAIAVFLFLLSVGTNKAIHALIRRVGT